MNHKQTHYYLVDITVGYIYRCNSKALHNHYREDVTGNQWLKCLIFSLQSTHTAFLLLSLFPLLHVLKSSLTKACLYLSKKKKNHWKASEFYSCISKFSSYYFITPTSRQHKYKRFLLTLRHNQNMLQFLGPKKISTKCSISHIWKGIHVCLNMPFARETSH